MNNFIQKILNFMNGYDEAADETAKTIDESCRLMQESGDEMLRLRNRVIDLDGALFAANSRIEGCDNEIKGLNYKVQIARDDARIGQELVAILSNYVGETGLSESAVEVLNRKLDELKTAPAAIASLADLRIRDLEEANDEWESKAENAYDEGHEEGAREGFEEGYNEGRYYIVGDSVRPLLDGIKAVVNRMDRDYAWDRTRAKNELDYNIECLKLSVADAERSLKNMR